MKEKGPKRVRTRAKGKVRRRVEEREEGVRAEHDNGSTSTILETSARSSKSDNANENNVRTLINTGTKRRRQSSPSS